jgi:hypothetical protein
VRIHFHEPKRNYPIDADRAGEMYQLLLAVHGRARMEAVGGVVHVYFGELA